MSSGNECTLTQIKKDLHQLKITVVGDGTVGKTCVLVTYKTKKFPEDYVATVFDNYTCEIIVDDLWFNICLWDTAGSEDYAHIRLLSYPETKCFLLCFAVDDRSSFDNIPIKWYPELRAFSRKIPVILVGTKSDLRETGAQCISTDEAVKMQKKIKAVKYIECSALKNQNVDHLIQEAVRVLIPQDDTWSCMNYLKIKNPFRH